MSRWTTNDSPDESPARTDTWPCWCLWKMNNPEHGNVIEVAAASWHTTADKARIEAARLNKAWLDGSYSPEPGALDFHAEGPVIGAPGDRRGAQAVREIMRTVFVVENDS